MIEGVADIRQAYRDQTVATRYIDERFREPVGALLHRRQAAVLRRVIADVRPQRVLEVAPGPARLTVETAPLLATPPVLIDASAQMLAVAEQRLRDRGCGATLIEGDAFSLPFRSTFDLVYTFRLVRHFGDEDRIRLYREIARTLRPGGVLVFDAVNAVVSNRIRARAAAGEYRHYDALLTREALVDELSHGGFSVQALVGLQHRYTLMQHVQTLVAPRSRALAAYAVELLDHSGGEPLEWVAVCRRDA